ncbi:LysR family transcriptional regulator substrate-binding protein [Paenibacillus sp. WC2504]|uniref:LysR family transcriptional regulator substrate-binding protein n=1 Tax=Paenibacillus sp. WC2504 TaxID=3461403 RepID=UPI004045A2B0
MFPSTHRCRKMIDSACSSLGFDLKPKIETTTIRSLLMLVRSGAGVSILSKTLLEMYPHQDLSMIRITNPSLSIILPRYFNEKADSAAVCFFIEVS